MRPFLLPFLLATVAACGNTTSLDDPDGDDKADRPGGTVDGLATRCASGKAGAACVLGLYDAAASSCKATAIGKLRTELNSRRKLGPLWANGRALFRTGAPVAIAGSFNGWSATALVARPLCGTDLHVGVGPVPSGSWQYKLTDGASWMLDPDNPAFAYDDFAGNPDGENSALVTPDAGRGQIVRLERACSTALGSCRGVTAYLPPGYDAPANASRRYPVVFMHDGQNVWDDHDCCFGHTGWEVNAALDDEIAAGRVRPVIVIAADNTPARNDEYGLSPSRMAVFMQFQVSELQPRALAQVRWDGQRVSVAGSSLGGLVSMYLALSYPQTYRAGASLSGAFWPGKEENDGTALRDRLPALGKQPVAIYLDHGGNPATDSDGAADSIEIRDLLGAMGWTRRDSPLCGAPGPSSLCYYTEPGATHDELAWKARAWRFLRFLAAP
jgi:predicted alpha/beta superfamily hydrolase